MPIRISSQFRPMTYDELSKPLIQATEAQMALEDQYSAMQTEAAKWQQLANEQTDHRAYTQLKAYSDDLSAQADALLKQGLSPSTRAAMLDMKRRYATDVTPVEQAYNKREQLIKEQRDAMLKDQTLRFSTDFSNVSLDQLLTNPNLQYQALSGNAIAKRVGDVASNYAKAISSDPQLSKVMNDQYWQLREQLGYTPQQILLEATNDPNAPSELRGLREAIHQELRGNAAYDKDWVDSYINQGMTNAIGTVKYDYSQNLGKLTAYQQLQKDEDDERKELQRRTMFYDPAHADEYSDVEGYDGYVMHGKSKYIFNKETGQVAATSLTQFKKDYEEAQKAAKLAKTRKAGITLLQENPLYFGGDDFSKKRDGNDKKSFDEDEAQEITFYMLSKKAQLVLNKHLNELGLTHNDIIIEKDQDNLSRNEYRIRIKPEVVEKLNFEE